MYYIHTILCILRSTSIKLQMKHAIINIMQIYAPLSDYSEDVYSIVQTTIVEIPPIESMTIMENCNAKDAESDLNTTCMNKYGIGEQNSNGDHLTELCEANYLALAKTFFKHPLKWRCILTSPNGEHRNQITIKKELVFLCTWCSRL